MTTTKQAFSTAILESKREFESNEFLPQLLRGGYELMARNTIYDNLPESIKSSFATEQYVPGTRKIADILDVKTGTLIDFGHNGTWQTQTIKNGLINKVLDDALKYILEPNIHEVYCLGLLTDIVTINNDMRELVTKYETTKFNLKRKSALKKINTVTNGLKLLDNKFNNEIVNHKFTNTNRGFEVDVHLFLLGPFNKMFQKDSILTPIGD